MSRRPVLSLLLVTVLAAPLSASAAPKPKVPVLTGTVKITASYSAIMDVRLPKAVDVGDGWNPPKGTTVTGVGRLIGAALVPASGKPVPVLEAMQFGFCNTEGCAGAKPWLSFRADDGIENSKSERLTAGDYRLLIVTDGKPVTVVIKLPGLKGSATFKPLRRISAKQLVPDYLPAAANSPVNTTYIGSVDGEIDGGLGLLYHQMQVQTDKSVQQSESFCVYDAPYPGQPAPACPGGRSIDFSFTRVAPEPATWRMWGRLLYLNPGGYRAGMYYNAIGLAHDPVGVLTFVTIPPR